jgi:hypothetical protein
MKIYVVDNGPFKGAELLVRGDWVVNGAYSVKISEDGLIASLDRDGRSWKAVFVADVPEDLNSKGYNEIFRELHNRGIWLQPE